MLSGLSGLGSEGAYGVYGFGLDLAILTAAMLTSKVRASANMHQTRTCLSAIAHLRHTCKLLVEIMRDVIGSLRLQVFPTPYVVQKLLDVKV